jgi:hypothetical protein
LTASVLSRFHDARNSATGRRVLSLLLALAIHGLLLLLLLTLAPQIIQPKKEERNPVSFTLAPAPSPKPAAQAKKAEKKVQPSGGAPKVVTREAPQEKKEEQPTPDLPFIQLSREDLASGDIGKLARRGDGGSGAGQGKDSGLAYGPGEGPGGEQMFNADWYRRPTHAELSTYMPANAPRTGYGLVACKTVEHFHVDNCQVLGEQPLGSGFGRAVRLAAWQFLVRPPSVGGRPQVGAWVRIKIEYVEGVVQ